MLISITIICIVQVGNLLYEPQKLMMNKIYMNNLAKREGAGSDEREGPGKRSVWITSI